MSLRTCPGFGLKVLFIVPDLLLRFIVLFHSSLFPHLSFLYSTQVYYLVAWVLLGHVDQMARYWIKSPIICLKVKGPCPMYVSFPYFLISPFTCRKFTTCLRGCCGNASGKLFPPTVPLLLLLLTADAKNPLSFTNCSSYTVGVAWFYST